LRSRLQIVLCLVLVYALNAVAQDRVFTYTYQSPVLRTGEREIEAWNTIQWGREEFFRAFEHRLELEMGVAPNLQTAFYLNVVTASASSALTTTTEVGFSNEWKWNLNDPVADPVGIALYGEYTIGAREIEFEPKIILDKASGPSVFALNLAAEFESEKEVNNVGELSTEQETMFQLAAGYSYQLGPHTAFGIEFQARAPLYDGAVQYIAVYAGPTFSFAGDKFWINVSVLPQLPALRGATTGNLVLDDEQRAEARLMLSYAL